ncbi:MAG: Fic family protein [Prevotella sp.]|nr:Fic family protein [Prevotella sp.]
MEKLRSDIRNDFEYSIRTYNPSCVCDGGCYLSEYDVMKAHYFLSDYFLSEGESVRFGILNFSMLSSAVSRQNVSYGDLKKWDSPLEIIATLVYGLTKNHAFNDGNKRTALLVLLLALKKIKRQANGFKKDFEQLLIRIAANQLSQYKEYKQFEKDNDAEVLFIADFIRRKTRKIDREFHSLTYEEFNSKLKDFGVWLDHPQHNTINVYKKEKLRLSKKITNALKLRHSKSQDGRILQIGFKGWKCQVNPKALKSVLQATGLTPEEGIDSKVFYYGADPEYKLIEEYYSVLKRLKDK